MATGSVRCTKYTKSDSPYTKSFSRSFTASARTTTTATQAGYVAVPTGYYATFAGFSTNNSVLLLNIFNPNAADAETLLSTRNISSSAQNNKTCNFHASYIRLDMIQDERNL